MDSRALPPNVAAAYDVIAQRGPLTPDEVVDVLRESGIVLTTTRVAKLPERFPLTFVMDAHNRLSLPPRPATPADREWSTSISDGDQDAGLAWHRANPPTAIPLDDFVVVMPASAVRRCTAIWPR